MTSQLGSKRNVITLHPAIKINGVYYNLPRSSCLHFSGHIKEAPLGVPCAIVCPDIVLLAQHTLLVIKDHHDTLTSDLFGDASNQARIFNSRRTDGHFLDTQRDNSARLLRSMDTTTVAQRHSALCCQISDLPVIGSTAINSSVNIKNDQLIRFFFVENLYGIDWIPYVLWVFKTYRFD